MRRKIVFESSAFADFNDWAKLDKKIHRKIIELIKNIDSHPFQGLGVFKRIKDPKIKPADQKFQQTIS